MIKRVHLVRHGQTVYNSLKKIQGSSDISLNEVGIKQAKEITIENKYDLYLHSGLKRSEETLDLILKDNTIKKEKEILIQERGYGIFEGLKEEEIYKKYPDLFDEWKKNENVSIDKAETIENVVNRIKKFIKKITINNNKNIFVVTHSGVLYSLYKYMKNLDYGIRPEIYFSNCISVHLEIIDNNNEIILKLYCHNDEIIEKIIDKYELIK